MSPTKGECVFLHEKLWVMTEFTLFQMTDHSTNNIACSPPDALDLPMSLRHDTTVHSETLPENVKKVLFASTFGGWPSDFWLRGK